MASAQFGMHMPLVVVYLAILNIIKSLRTGNKSGAYIRFNIVVISFQCAQLEQFEH